MSSSMWFLVLAMVIMESGIGITLNTWIVVFSVKNIKNRSNQVHLTMGLVNILIQCLMTTQSSLWAFGPQLILKKEIYLFLNFMTFFLICCIYWLSSWLCAFYCISIANFTHQLFIWLRRRLLAFLPHLLLLSVGGSLVTSIPTFWVVFLESKERTSGNCTLGDTEDSETFQIELVYLIFFVFLGCCLPLAVTLLSIILTIGSLLQHIHSMRQNNLDFDQTKLEAHSNAIKTIAFHLILALFFYVAEMLCFTSEKIIINAKTIIVFFCLLSYPTAQAVVIFQSNSKLRNVFVNIFCSKNLCTRTTEPMSG
uniref:Taste receptor type 2 n=1 Tax=Pyxicephalus adspersus TaxID=30357 RepID=A0AAV3AAR4_PYXAD|nr:TPA: hypothetical protein GDO54_014829 [Pyxicephalus adspersus]